MHGEDRRHQRARPYLPGHPPQDEKQEQGRGGVQQHVGQMASGGTGTIKLAVRHERQPRQRVPVGGMALGERPSDPGGAQAVGNLRIIVNVQVVVEVDKVEVSRLREDQPDRQQKKAADHQQRVAVLRLGLGAPRTIGCAGGPLFAPARVACLRNGHVAGTGRAIFGRSVSSSAHAGVAAAKTGYRQFFGRLPGCYRKVTTLQFPGVRRESQGVRRVVSGAAIMQAPCTSGRRR